jgi:hypothetical protein
MRQKLLITVAAVALLAGTGLAAAQGHSQGAPAAAGAQGAAPAKAHEGAGRERGARMDQGGKMDQGAKMSGEPPKPSAGAAAADDGKGKRLRKGTAEGPVKGKAKSAQDQNLGKGRDKGARQAGSSDDTVKMQNDNKARRSAEGSKRPGSSATINERTRIDATAEGRERGDRGRAGTSAQGGAASASVSVKLSAEQRNRIHGIVVKQGNAPRIAHADFSIRVGTVVPRGRVHLVPVPRTIVEIEPQWRGFLYFLVGDQLVIVEPDTLKIVAVIAA